jgi:hypothetical protein
MALGVVVGADHLGDIAPPVVVDLGLPARQAAAVIDEGPGIEVADAADVGIERQVAAEAQPHRHLQLDDLLPVPAGQQVEAREPREEVALGPHRYVDVGEARQAGPQQMRVVTRRDDQQLERLAVAPVLGERFDQKTGALQVAPALNRAQSQGQDGLADF